VIVVGTARGQAVSRPLWWPPVKIAGRYLAAHHSGQLAGTPTITSGVVVELRIDPERDQGLSRVPSAAWGEERRHG
jgi:hypothetical protein